MRRFFLVSYDVSDDKRRNKVAKRLLDYGERVQYSVFCCQLNARELLRLRMELKSDMNERDDQVLFADVGPVNGEYPKPDITYEGRTWSPIPRTQIV